MGTVCDERPGNPVLMFRESERYSPYFPSCFPSESLYRPVDSVVELQGEHWSGVKSKCIVFRVQSFLSSVLKCDFPPVPGLSDECTYVRNIEKYKEFRFRGHSWIICLHSRSCDYFFLSIKSNYEMTWLEMCTCFFPQKGEGDSGDRTDGQTDPRHRR